MRKEWGLGGGYSWKYIPLIEGAFTSLDYPLMEVEEDLHKLNQELKNQEFRMAMVNFIIIIKTISSKKSLTINLFL